MRIIRSPRPVDDFAGNDKKIAREYPEAARGRIIRILVQSILILALVAVSASAQDRSEIKKIDFLIESVEKLQGAKFIRNGSEYSGKEAADHLKMKLRKTGGRVRTADDFIRLCASKSYLSGKPYLIRYANGKTINSEKYFREQLLLYKNNN